MPFQVVFGDIMRTISPNSLGEFRFASTITDQFSSLHAVHPPKAKNDVRDAIHFLVKTFVIPLEL